MILYFITQGRFIRRGTDVYCIDNSMTLRLWDRYLESFSEIRVVARVLSDNNYPVKEVNLASSEKVSFIDLPYYIGPLQYLKVKMKISKILNDNIKKGFAYLCRVPSPIGNAAYNVLKKKNIPYGVEVVGDPWDVYAPGNFNHPLRPFLRYYSFWCLKKIVEKSSCSFYVTEYTLQNRYPVGKKTFQIAASDVMIKPCKDIIPKRIEKKDCYNLISVGSLAQMYKSPDDVLRAIQILKKENINVHLIWLGDGVYKKKMIEYSDILGLSEHVSFIGNVSLSEVLRYLDNSDIFLLVSKTEGLPRALIEAMSRGLPCIGSKVGGIPELLETSVIIEPGNYIQLAERIRYMIENPEFANEQARINLNKSQKYTDDVLSSKRKMFYEKLKEIVK